MNEQTMSKLLKMRLYGMARALKLILETGIGKLSSEELLCHLVDTEYDDRNNRKLERLIKQAKFRYQALYTDIDYAKERNLDKNLMLKIAEGNWIKQKQNIIVTGPTGVGKSYLVCAIGNQICTQGFKVLYYNSGKLFSYLKYCKADGSYLSELERISRQELLIIDDFGLKPLDTDSRYFLLEVLEDRYMRNPVIIASQLPVNNWHELIGDSTIADSILDRLVHNSLRIELKGESMRKVYKKILDER